MRRTDEADQTVRPRLKRTGLIGALAALSLMASASTSTAAVSIGQLAPSPPTGTCTLTRDRVQPTVTAGESFVVPNTAGISNWTLTSWSHNAKAGAGQSLGMKVFRKVANPATYSAVAHDGPRPLTPSALNTFAVNIPVKAGDVLGSVQTDVTDVACSFTVTGDSYLFSEGSLSDGVSAPFAVFADRRLNISAVVTPTNSFTVATVKRNKKNGTATLTLKVPNPGSLAVGGKGVRTGTATTGAAGDVTVKIKATGKKKSKLNASGKVSVTADVTFTPTGGDPVTQSQKVKLKKG